jgi:CheY-like chemotaxis protein
VETSQYILVVEDDRAIQDVIKLILQDEGYRVNVASNGRRALAAIAAFPPALIFLDIWMPEMDGRAFLEAYNQLPEPHAPVIGMSAGDKTLENKVAKQLAGFIAKPFDLNDLLQLVHMYLG